ncbi:histone deacetylase [Picosynechococcus sp. NKBG15041c]|uniref:histone deacetylase family protein n=1 Tax=Picosynechococcus sp. NKBG15041c TaxID=1407650 RepID=UPI00041620C4|nr:histone deacetylase [Picosynechococcus sp. NKBG15041c]
MIHVIYSAQFLGHDTGRGHPESPRRLEAITAALKAVPWAKQIIWHEPTAIARRNPLPWVHQCHGEYYLRQIQKLAESGGGHWDLDTLVSPKSFAIALLAVNACLDGVDLACKTQEPVFALVRPPGHHATRTTGMGFCLLSNVAIAAHYALTLPGMQKVAILDWDVHHGNGTEFLVEQNPAIFYCSLHQDPAYPGTGQAHDQGQHQNILNIPLRSGTGGDVYAEKFQQVILPRLNSFQPDLLIVSAGYDANAKDPLASMNLQPRDYRTFSEFCQQLHCPIVFALEGGYHLQALADSVVATLEPFVQ